MYNTPLTDITKIKSLDHIERAPTKAKNLWISNFTRSEEKTVAGEEKREDGAIAQPHILPFIIITAIIIIIIIIITILQVKRRGKMARSPGPTFSRKINFFSEKVWQNLEHC